MNFCRSKGLIKELIYNICKLERTVLMSLFSSVKRQKIQPQHVRETKPFPRDENEKGNYVVGKPMK